MKVVPVTCPHCGARLRVESTILYVRCEYCGTNARLQARTRMLERIDMPGMPPGPQGQPWPHSAPPPMRPMMPPMPAPPRRAGGNTVVLGVVAGMVSLLGVGAGAMFMTTSRVHDAARAGTTPAATGGAAATKQAPAPKREWNTSHGILVAKLDGDEVPEIIGRASHEGKQDVHLIALDGATGRVRWESEVISTSSSGSRAQLWLAGDLLLLVEHHTVRAYETASGRAKWSVKLDEHVQSVCDGGADAVLAVGADGDARRVRRSNGQVIETVAQKKPCAPLPDDARVNRSQYEGDLGRKYGMQSARSYRHGAREAAGIGAGKIIVGGRSTGTPVATVAAVDAKGGLRWKTTVSPVPLESPDQYPSSVAIGEQEVCMPYTQGLHQEAWHATCFALADGKRTFDVENKSRFGDLLVVGRGLLAVTGGELVMFELETGARRWQL